MSGLEIAGVVLGAIPLVIAAIEHYEDVTTPMKIFLRFKGEVRKVIRELGNLHVSYEMSLKVLLQPIVGPQELVDMIKDPASNMWLDANVDGDLRNSLGDAHLAYMRTIEDIEGAMTEILNAISLPESSKGPGERVQETLDRFREHSKITEFQIKDRFNYSKRRKRIKSRLEDIRSYIALLDSYEEKATKIAARETATASTSGSFKFTLPFRVLQTNATKLYDVLSQSWCSSHPSHSAGLLLEQRVVARKCGRERSDPCDTSRFELSFLQPPTSKEKWLDAEFRLVEYHSTTSTQRKAQVRVVVTTPDLEGSTEPASPYDKPDRLQVVKDLCLALENHCYRSAGFCFDHTGCLRGAYEAQRLEPLTYHDDSLSLKDLTQQSGYQLSMKDKYMLSITLTSALLQLSPTPWLRERWDKSNIIFLRANDNHLSHIPVDIAHPYLIHRHENNVPHQAKNPLIPETDSSNLLSLGVMLVEILQGQSIESICLPEDKGPNNEVNQFTNFQTIKRWLAIQESRGNISLSCFDAIQYCLECFAKPTARLADEEFAKTVLDKVLVPLAVELNSLFGYRPGSAKA